MNPQYVAGGAALAAVGLLTLIVAGLISMITTRADVKTDVPFMVALLGGIFVSVGVALLVGYFIYLWVLSMFVG